MLAKLRIGVAGAAYGPNSSHPEYMHCSARDAKRQRWLVTAIAAAVAAIGAVGFAGLGSGRVQEWNAKRKPRKKLIHKVSEAHWRQILEDQASQ